MLDKLSKAQGAQVDGPGAYICGQHIERARAGRKIYFLSDSATLDATSEPVLRDIATAIHSCGRVQLQIIGHTDDFGSSDYNQDLSERRAKTVKDALIFLGTTKAQLVALGYGEAYPIADNHTPEGRALNRRVEIMAFDPRRKAARCSSRTTGKPNMTGSGGYNQLSATVQQAYDSYDCRSNTWFEEQSSLRFSASELGLETWSIDASLGYARMIGQTSNLGLFVDIYASQARNNRLAEGVLQGYGASAALAGATYLFDGIGLDYFLGGSLGRNSYNLIFEEAWTINATGHYDDWAAFAGAALSGETRMWDTRIRPRAGFAVAYAPEVTSQVTTRTFFGTEFGALQLGETSSARAYGELQLSQQRSFNWYGQTDLLASASGAPRFYCEQGFSDTNLDCGYGGWLEIATEAPETASSLHLRLDAEKAMFGDAWSTSLSLGFSQGFWDNKGVWRSEFGLTGNNAYQIGQSVQINF